MQDPEILEREEIRYVGMGVEHNVHSSAAGKGDPVTELWGKFAPRSSEIRNSMNCYLGICGPVLPGGLSTYIAALRVSEFSEIPEGMIFGKVPSGYYARFLHQGPIEKIWSTVDFIHNHWMPNAGYKGHDCSQVEVYTWGTDVHDESFKLEILVPLV